MSSVSIQLVLPAISPVSASLNWWMAPAEKVASSLS
jgi:hypothetical protein